jgi:hypothetical protein
MCHKSLGISHKVISAESGVGALENTRFKRVKLDGILFFLKITPILNQNNEDDKKFLDAY